MARLSIPRFFTSQFNYTKNNPCFYADASDLGAPIWGQVYDDACDAGFILVSSKTGKEILVTVVREYTSEGDLLQTEFKSTDPAVKFDVIVFND